MISRLAWLAINGSQAFVLIYVLIYNTLNYILLMISFARVRGILVSERILSPEQILASPYAPAISLLVPAYNEEVTIVESIKSLQNLKYPRYEIIIVNDGSRDATLEKLQKAFGFARRDMDYAETFPTAAVRGLYEAREGRPEHVLRMVLIDKENGGKADALNAAANAARCPYVCTMDADSIMEEKALLQIVRPILEDSRGVVACGGQVAIANGCTVERGRVTRIALPRKWVPLFQVVEYLRSFTAGRTALARLNALLVLSGVFAVFRRDILEEVGGFLTPRMRNRIALEYCGEGRSTVCEDMEIVMRIHRYLRDKGIPGRIAYLPHPISWTECPEDWSSLRKQRNRWFRGLGECLWMHRGIFLNPRYGRIGLFAMPYQFLFEFLGPIMELVGYASIPLLWLGGYLQSWYLAGFLLAATAYGCLLSVLAVLIGFWKEGRIGPEEAPASLFRFASNAQKAKLVACAILVNIGYRQLLTLFLGQAVWDLFKRKKSWEKFERKGFENPPGS